jgi:hypothetical protein
MFRTRYCLNWGSKIYMTHILLMCHLSSFNTLVRWVYLPSYLLSVWDTPFLLSLWFRPKKKKFSTSILPPIQVLVYLTLKKCTRSGIWRKLIYWAKSILSCLGICHITTNSGNEPTMLRIPSASEVLRKLLSMCLHPCPRQIQRFDWINTSLMYLVATAIFKPCARTFMMDCLSQT